jgi:hypothetical protein
MEVALLPAHRINFLQSGLSMPQSEVAGDLKPARAIQAGAEAARQGCVNRLGVAVAMELDANGRAVRLGGLLL